MLWLFWARFLVRCFCVSPTCESKAACKFSKINKYINNYMLASLFIYCFCFYHIFFSLFSVLSSFFSPLSSFFSLLSSLFYLFLLSSFFFLLSSLLAVVIFGAFLGSFFCVSPTCESKAACTFPEKHQNIGPTVTGVC